MTDQHSSVPPEHTGIGVMSQIVSGLEDNPFEIKVGKEAGPKPFPALISTAYARVPLFDLAGLCGQVRPGLPQIIRQATPPAFTVAQAGQASRGGVSSSAGPHWDDDGGRHRERWRQGQCAA